MNTETKPQTKASKIGDIILNILLVAVLVILALSVATAVKFKENPDEAYLFGYRPLYILTGSMEPVLKEKGICLVKQSTYDEVEVDDIITYKVGEKTITHRIIEKTEEGIRTKGDNNNVEDAYLLQPENIKAKVVFIFNGSAYIINDLQRGPIGYVKWIGFPIFVIVIFVVLKKVIKRILAEEDAETNENEIDDTDIDMTAGIDEKDDDTNDNDNHNEENSESIDDSSDTEEIDVDLFEEE